MGILFALTAMFSWGLGDFLIQKSARKFGDWIALFYITAFSSIVLFPFIYKDLINSLNGHSILLFTAGFVILVAALLDFEALRVGKISIIEPIYALEIMVVVFLSTFIAREQLSFMQIFLVALSMLGIVLLTTKSFSHFKGIRLEKGIWYAIFGTICMGSANFLFGIGARETNPLIINWFTSIFIATIASVYLVYNSKFKEVAKDFKENKRLIFNVSFFDNLAWVTFSFATLYIPIAVATSISEGYIAFASFLGLIFNKEKLRYHQVLGFFISFISIILISIITE